MLLYRNIVTIQFGQTRIENAPLLSSFAGLLGFTDLSSRFPATIFASLWIVVFIAS